MCLLAGGALVQFDDSGERGEPILLRGEVERRDITLPGEGQWRRDDAGERVGVSGWRDRDDRPDTLLDLGHGQYRPAAEAPTNQTDPLVVDLVGDVTSRSSRQVVQQATQVRLALGDNLL